MAFTVSLADVLIQADQVWGNPIKNRDKVAKVEAAKAIMDRQNAEIKLIQDEKDLTVKVYWQNACFTDEACSDECSPATNTATDATETYVLDGCRQASFKIDEKDLRGRPHTIESVYAENLLANMRALDVYLAKQGIAFLEANKGDHEYTSIPGASIVTDDYEIPEANWNNQIFSYLAAAAEISQFNAPFLLDGDNLWHFWFNAKMNQGNGEGKGDFAKSNFFDAYFDLPNMLATAPGKTYLINGGAVALATGNYWGDAPMERAGNHRVYRKQSMNLPGIYYDVHEIETCTSGSFSISVQLKVYFKYLLNPKGCEAGRTGILSFEKVAGS
jgi:hypothetical protein